MGEDAVHDAAGQGVVALPGLLSSACAQLHSGEGRHLGEDAVHDALTIQGVIALPVLFGSAALWREQAPGRRCGPTMR